MHSRNRVPFTLLTRKKFCKSQDHDKPELKYDSIDQEHHYAKLF